MFNLKRVLVVASAFGVLAAGAAGPAYAVNESGSAECGVGGTASTSPAVGIGPNSGTYTFNDLAFECVVQDEDDGTVVQGFDITSSGTYNNTQCGTGSATDTDASAARGTPNDSSKLTGVFPITGIGYNVAFVRGTGALTVSSGTLNNGSSLSGGGTIQIVPAPSSPPNVAAGECTNGFAVAGQVSLDYQP